MFETKFSEKTQTTFIDVEWVYPNAPLSIVIFGKAKANFKEGPETLYNYKDKQICVTGVVKEYRNQNPDCGN